MWNEQHLERKKYRPPIKTLNLTILLPSSFDRNIIFSVVVVVVVLSFLLIVYNSASSPIAPMPYK
jgi:hypothetical protein